VGIFTLRNTNGGGFGIPKPSNNRKQVHPSSVAVEGGAVPVLIYTVYGGGIVDTWATANNTPTANQDNINAGLGRHCRTLSLKYHMAQILRDDTTINENELLSSVWVLACTIDTASTSATASDTAAAADGTHCASSIVFCLSLMVRRDGARSIMKINRMIYLVRCPIDECDGCVRMDVLLWLSMYSSSAIMMNESSSGGGNCAGGDGSALQCAGIILEQFERRRQKMIQKQSKASMHLSPLLSYYSFHIRILRFLT